MDIGDSNITTYHGYFAYNCGELTPSQAVHDDRPRRHQLWRRRLTRANGQPERSDRRRSSRTVWGAGVKFFPSPSVGARFGIQWTPTYIKSDAAGYWCDPYWGCYMVGDAQSSNQWDISGGIPSGSSAADIRTL